MTSESTGSTAEVDVLVVGGGAVGMFLGAMLGMRGVSTLVVERDLQPRAESRMMAPSVRTMEFCRQLGIADKVHQLPAGWAMDNVWVTSMDGHEIARVPAPPSDQPGSPGFSEHSPQFPPHCPQPTWERLLEEHALSYANVRVWRGLQFQRLAEHADKVLCTLRRLSTGDIVEVEARYVVSCEGVGSSIVKQLQIPVDGKLLDNSHSVEFTCEDLLAEHDKGPALRYTLIDENGTWGTLVVVDGRHRWRLVLYGLSEEGLSREQVEQKIVKAIGHEFSFDVVVQGRWRRRAAVVASYGTDRIFIAGDAAHASPPNGGFGMNTGIADAANLAWKLQAAVEGWAGPELLRSYESERRPVAQLTLAEAVRNYSRLVHDTAHKDIAADTEAGAEARRAIGDKRSAESRHAWWPDGMHLGYGYPWSTIVVPDPTEFPQHSAQHYEPSTSPGFRAPHMWLPDGRSTLDLFGARYVLLRLTTETGVGDSLVQAATAAGVPLDVQQIDNAEVAALFAYPLVLVRPDGHVAWRGLADPSDPDAVIRVIRGDSRAVAPVLHTV